MISRSISLLTDLDNPLHSLKSNPRKESLGENSGISLDKGHTSSFSLNLHRDDAMSQSKEFMSELMSDESSLLSLIRKVSYREGDFTLSSGKKSTFYIDLKATSLHPDGAYWIGKAIVHLAQTHRLVPAGVGGLTLGADPIATAVSLAAREQNLLWPAFIVRKEPKTHGTHRYMEGAQNLPPRAAVLVVEDVATTGSSSLMAVTRLRAEGYHPLAVCAVVDREEGAGARLAASGLHFFNLFTLSQVRLQIS